MHRPTRSGDLWRVPALPLGGPAGSTGPSQDQADGVFRVTWHWKTPEPPMSHQQIRRHWFYVARHFSLDFVIVVLAFLAGTVIRFGAQWPEKFPPYLPSVFIGAVTLPCVAYILGLYSLYHVGHGTVKRAILVTVAFHVAILVVIAFGYLNWSARIGRGVMFASYLVAAGGVIFHHVAIFLRIRGFRERVTFIVGSPFDEREAKILKSLDASPLEFVGVVSGPG